VPQRWRWLGRLQELETTVRHHDDHWMARS